MIEMLDDDLEEFSKGAAYSQYGYLTHDDII